MNSVRSNSLSLKYHRFTTSGSKDIGVLIFEFVAKTQFLAVLHISGLFAYLEFNKSSFLRIKNYHSLQGYFINLI